MKEIDKDFYCSAGLYLDGSCRAISNISVIYSGSPCNVNCPNRHRKHPSPSEYKEEYGEEYPDDGAVYGFYADFGWLAGTLKGARLHQHYEITGGFGFCESIVCAATPFGKPDPDWRPA